MLMLVAMSLSVSVGATATFIVLLPTVMFNVPLPTVAALGWAALMRFCAVASCVTSRLYVPAVASGNVDVVPSEVLEIGRAHV